MASSATRNRQAITPAQSIINFAADEGWCNYIRFKLFSEIKKKANPIDREELDHLRSYCNLHLSALLPYNFQTASCSENSIAVTKVNFDNGTIEYPTTKNGDPFVVHLSE